MQRNCNAALPLEKPKKKWQGIVIDKFLYASLEPCTPPSADADTQSSCQGDEYKDKLQHEPDPVGTGARGTCRESDVFVELKAGCGGSELDRWRRNWKVELMTPFRTLQASPCR